MSSKNAHVGLYLLASTDTLEFMKKVPILASAIKDMTALIICEMTSTVILLGGNPPMPQPPPIMVVFSVFLERYEVLLKMARIITL